MSSPQNTQSQPNAGLIFAELNAFQRSGAMKGAIDLDLFTLTDNGAVTASQIAEKAQANGRGVRILRDFLVVHGHLTKQNQDYGLTPTSKQFLSKNSRAYMGSLPGFLLHEQVAGAFRDVAGVVRRGGPPPRTLID